jgi:hypothetical protein
MIRGEVERTSWQRIWDIQANLAQEWATSAAYGIY